ncbi:serine hydrolase domain-containing protein [Fibrella forsythiae]|uniref:Serine hydrolase n=1 Tax=Fibrella forsythiae TaxID=2817061 RepID=A0ABS3JSB9_9BACT|nr:serine hydrolase domain-containing protein [Fibrella forsythiae]MBO0952920.1 serine hydrolase [Fibrella forsythiae]
MSSRLTPLLTSLLLVLTHTVTVAQSAPPALAAEQLTRRIDSIQKATAIPGLQVLVFTRDSLLYRRNAGLRNLTDRTPVTDQTLFPVASVTKSFVAASALLLIQQGKLALTDELKTLAPEISFSNPWEATDPVRVAHLLEHTAGFDDWSPKAYAYDGSRLSLKDGLQITPESRTCRWRPGTFMSYTNTGPPLVARIIEKKTGQEFESFVRQHLLRPLGMNRATFRRDGAALTDLATGYTGQQAVPYWHLLLRPAGGLNVSALELMSFVQLLMNRGSYHGQQLLAPALVDRMETPVTSLAARAGATQGYGLHNFTTAYQGHILHGHDGGSTGLRAHYLYHSGLNRGIIILVNSDGPGFNQLKDAVLAAVMQGVPPQLPPVYPLSETQKQAWVGHYRPSNFRLAITGWFLGLTELLRIREEKGNLLMQDGVGSETVPLRPVGANQALRMDKRGYTAQVTLVQNEAGEPVVARSFGSGIVANTATKTSAWRAWLPLILGHVSLLLLVVMVFMGFGWLIRGIRLRRRGRQLSALPLRVVLVVYAFSYLVMGLCLNMSNDTLGVVSPLSVLVFITSLLGPLAALGALLGLVRSYSRIPGRTDRLFLSVAVGSALLVVGYMAAWGLVGLRIWQ